MVGAHYAIERGIEITVIPAIEVCFAVKEKHVIRGFGQRSRGIFRGLELEFGIRFKCALGQNVIFAGVLHQRVGFFTI